MTFLTIIFVDGKESIPEWVSKQKSMLYSSSTHGLPQEAAGTQSAIGNLAQSTLSMACATALQEQARFAGR